jgi:hypothetical protein
VTPAIELADEAVDDPFRAPVGERRDALEGRGDLCDPQRTWHAWYLWNLSGRETLGGGSRGQCRTHGRSRPRMA